MWDAVQLLGDLPSVDGLLPNAFNELLVTFLVVRASGWEFPLVLNMQLHKRIRDSVCQSKLSMLKAMFGRSNWNHPGKISTSESSRSIWVPVSSFIALRDESCALSLWAGSYRFAWGKRIYDPISTNVSKSPDSLSSVHGGKRTGAVWLTVSISFLSDYGRESC